MTRTARLSLLVSTALVAAAGLAMAQMDRAAGAGGSASKPANTASGDSRGFGFGRFDGRFMAEFDLNGDGRVTRDELNKALGQKFASSGANGGMNLAQFTASRQRDFRQRSDQTFHRIDWNGDGKLSLDEFTAPERARFIAMDRKAAGTIFCSSRRGGQTDTATPAKVAAGNRSQRGNGRAAFCAENDLNKDGHVTRAEFDKATAQRFASAAKGGNLTVDGYYAITVVRFRESAQRMFARLDTNNDGKLSLAEFGAPQMKSFVHADKNNDGAVTRDELGRGHRFGRDGKPGARTAPG